MKYERRDINFVFITLAKKIEMVDKTMNAIILCLDDKFLRKFFEEKITSEMWVKLDSLYMTKSLTHKLCLKQ